MGTSETVISYVNVDANYLKELKERADQAEYRRGYIDGLESALASFEELFHALTIKKGE